LSAPENNYPSETGTYLLILKLEDFHDITVGQIGTHTFRPGYYLYLGSAFGSGGIRARLGRHVRGGEKNFWHIDYLRSKSEVAGVWFQISPKVNEHNIAAWLASRTEIDVPVPGFGSSDCRCLSHLLFSAILDSLKVMRANFEVVKPGGSAWFFMQFAA